MAEQTVDLKALNQQLKLLLANPASVAAADDATRHEFKMLTRHAVAETEQPFETLMRTAYAVRAPQLSPHAVYFACSLSAHFASITLYGRQMAP